MSENNGQREQLVTRWDSETQGYLSLTVQEATIRDTLVMLEEVAIRQEAVTAAIRDLGRAIERASIPWWLRFWWKRRAEKLEARLHKEEQEKLDKDRAHVRELLKNRSPNSRYRPRW